MLLERDATDMGCVWVLGDSQTDGSVLPERQMNASVGWCLGWSHSGYRGRVER